MSKQIFGGVKFEELEHDAHKHEWNAGFTAKDMRVELYIYSPEEMAMMPWRGILKGFWIKIKNSLKRNHNQMEELTAESLDRLI